MKPVLNNGKEVVRRLLGLFCASLEGDIILTFKAIVLARREFEAEVDLLIGGTLNRKNSIRINSSIYSPGVTDYPFKTDLPLILPCLLKLSI